MNTHMWKRLGLCAVSAVAATLAIAPAVAAPAFSSKAPVVETASVVQTVGWRIVCHGRWHHKRCHRVWVPRRHWN
jgi:hypothetical protein